MEKIVSPKEGTALLRLARQSIAAKFKGRDTAETDHFLTEIPQAILKQKKGVFVTLHKKERLRGCIGNIEPIKPLVLGVKENAISAAFSDHRFSPLSQEELSQIHIEISILGDPEKMKYKDTQDLLAQLTPGVDGVIVEKNLHRATFLPQVWDQLPTPEEFLAHLCMKAGLSANEWEKGGLTLHTYQVQSFSEREGDVNFTR